MNIQQTNDSCLVAKRSAGYAAAGFIQDKMIVGIGTGSTVTYFIESLAQRCRDGLMIKAVASSLQSQKQAEKEGIPLLSPDAISYIDITVDGADEIDQKKNMIKGRGGALLREKLLSQSSREMIVIIDESKVVPQLGKVPVPIEIHPFAFQATLFRLAKEGYEGEFRFKEDNIPYLTDNGHYIFDLYFSIPIVAPKKEHERLKLITGVLETGLFFDISPRVIIGQPDGSVKIWT